MKCHAEKHNCIVAVVKLVHFSSSSIFLNKDIHSFLRQVLTRCHGVHGQHKLENEMILGVLYFDPLYMRVGKQRLKISGNGQKLMILSLPPSKWEKSGNISETEKQSPLCQMWASQIHQEVC